ncbi:MAG TPA: sensor histidine kinase [Candidatus Dormibacteraeota bacterium]|nr:sensor histidine kinase [Candidatus Dormibacteraeota bacterium]
MTTAMAARHDRGWSPAGVLVAAVAGSLAVASLVLAVADWASPSPTALAGLSAESSNAVEVTVQTIGLFTLAAMASLVVWRQPSNVFGWVLAATVISLSVEVVAEEYAVYGLVVAVGSLPLADVAAMLSHKVLPDVVGTGAIAAILVFPDGRLKSDRWLLVIAAAGVAALLDILSRLNDQSELFVGLFTGQYVPAYVPPALWPVGEMFGWASTAHIWGAVPALIAGVGVVMRMAASRGEARLQLQWFAWAASLFAIAGLLSLAVGLLGPSLSSFSPSDAAWAITGWARMANGVAGMILIPISIGIAIARYRLYDIDIVVNRTILFAGLAVFVTGSYAIVVAGVGSVLGQRAGANPVLTVVTIALVAALLLPVRGWLQSLADVAVYGRRARPYDVLSDLVHDVGRAEPAAKLLPRMAALLRDGTRSASSEVWVKVDERLQLAAAAPDLPSTPPPAVGTSEIAARLGDRASIAPVLRNGELLGALVVVKPRGEQLNNVERRLFDDLASQAGVVFERFRLVQELRESRARIVAAQESERRRIERNLHDAAQQRFANALLSLGMAQAEVSQTEAASRLMQEASREVKAGLGELRDLARGLNPPMLAEAGLAAAVRSLSDRSSLVTTVTVRCDRRYPDAIESAAYYVVTESLANAVKHSGARSVEITISESNGHLEVEVVDDGVGGADAGRGSGILGLRDRAAAVGGTLTVDSPAGGGTRVKVELPCA